MKALLTALIVSVATLGLAPSDADARRLGSGGSSGMQRSLPAQTPPAALPAKPATAPAAAPATAGAPAAAAATGGARRWLGPIAGLAAGLGLAALMSHLGMGAEFANIIMMVLLAVVAFVAVRFLLRRFGPNAGAKPAVASANGMQFSAQRDPWAKEPATATPAVGSGSGWNAAPAQPQASFATDATPARVAALPADFDAPAFERIAKMIFIRMQAANDAADLNDLRNFTTPELFASVKLDLQERGAKAQQTDVVKVDAEVLEVTTEGPNQVVSVRFHGLIREDIDGVAGPFDEVWHLVKPTEGGREWAIAGIQQMA